MYLRKDKPSRENQIDKFTIIDLDPYGSAIPFLDSALQSVEENGLMCVTFTDLRNLCGPEMARCFYLYGISRAKVLCY
jgi:tRNA (guanine26-N2/guanine27-N2)-dimethyltransferase